MNEMILVISAKMDRLHNITLEDILAAGCPVEHYPENCNGMSHAAFGWFEYFWDSINLKRGFGYKDNPWVWVVRFQLVEGLQMEILEEIFNEFYDLIDKDRVFVSTKTGEHITGPEKLIEMAEKYDPAIANSLVQRLAKENETMVLRE